MGNTWKSRGVWWGLESGWVGCRCYKLAVTLCIVEGEEYSPQASGSPFLPFTGEHGEPLAIWVASAIEKIPPGSLIINPQTGKPYLNPDGSVYRWYPPTDKLGSSSSMSSHPSPSEHGKVRQPALLLPGYIFQIYLFFYLCQEVRINVKFKLHKTGILLVFSWNVMYPAVLWNCRLADRRSCSLSESCTSNSKKFMA